MQRSLQSELGAGHSVQGVPGPVRILVVDGRPMNAELLGAFLTSEGYEVISAGSGRDVLAKVAAEDPSLVLLGSSLADMDGCEVCRLIKSAPSAHSLPVVMVTGPKDVEERAKGVEAGADDFLGRPVERQELLTRVRSLLRVRALQDALVERSHQLTEMSHRVENLERSLNGDQVSSDAGHGPRSDSQVPHFRPAVVYSPRPPAQAAMRQPVGQHPPAATGAAEVDRNALVELKRYVRSRLSDSLEELVGMPCTPETVAMLDERLRSLYEASGSRLSDPMRQQLFDELRDDILGYGPISPLLADPTVTEIMVNGYQSVYVERDGRVRKTDIQFDDDDHILRLIDRIIRPLGRRIDKYSPMVDARLPDGSRVNAIIAPCAIDGPALTVRKFSQDKLTVEDLVVLGSITPSMAEFLRACVHSRLNIVVSGGTGSGKTTLLNVLSSFIPAHERIVTIEDSAELQLHQEHVVRLEANPPDREGRGEVTIRDLVRNALRMRPERIVVGEVRGAEALDMLQAMNTGHDGSLTTVHANTPRDTMGRLETLVLMAGLDLPARVVRVQLASAIHLIIQQARLRDGSRKVVSVTEVQGMEGEAVVLSEIFTFREQGAGEEKVIGELVPTGVRPKFTPRLRAAGFSLSADIFMPNGPAAAGRRRNR